MLQWKVLKMDDGSCQGDALMIDTSLWPFNLLMSYPLLNAAHLNPRLKRF